MQVAEAKRAGRIQSMLRLNLSIRDGSYNVYWKHDGARFAGKSVRGAKPTDWRSQCSGSTLKLCTGRTYQLTLTTSRPAKLRPGSGRWDVKEIDSEGREVQPQFEVLPPLPPSLSLSPPQPSPPGSAPLPLSTPPSQLPPSTSYPSNLSQPSSVVPSAALAGDGPAAGGDSDGAGTDPRVLRWVDASADAARSTFTAELRISLAPTEPGRRQYLLLEAYVEDFGLAVCPLQIKVYKPNDKNALSSFPLRFVQFDFREDSSSVGDLFAVNYYKY